MAQIIGEFNQDFYNLICNDIKKTITNNCIQYIYEIMQETIYKVVYNAYNPTEYNRRYENDGGLADMSTYDFKIDINTIGFTLSVFTNAQGNEEYGYQANLLGRDIDECIVDGDMYSWTKSKIYEEQPFPRDFYEATLEELIDNGQLDYILRTELNKKGINLL